MKKVILHFVFLWICFGTLSSQSNISGTVSDQTGLPLIGANVIVKGYTAIGTITDAEGKFSITTPQDATILEVSYTGYEGKEVAFKPGQFLEIMLVEGKLIDEVVVTALGISKSNKTLGYSTAVISGD